MSFLVVELIRKKRDGHVLSREEMAFLVDGFARGTIPDYQISAWLMAAFLKGLDKTETLSLTECMKNSGTSLDWRSLSSQLKTAKFADKHSTGGVGDKVSLILAPLAVCLGVKVPMMSGRGLGFTGGTVDKLQSIPGFNMYPDTKTRIRCLEEVGVCMMAQSADLCPADRKLYSLRDVTATVENVPLITGSIVSKKWAAGVDAIVYDVKCGTGAFMSTRDEAVALSKSLVEVSKLAGMRAQALVTRMDQPLGAGIGNVLEVRESVAILSHQYSNTNAARLAAPIADLSCRLAAQMAVLAGARPNIESATQEAHECLQNVEALKVFQRMIVAQGGHAEFLNQMGHAECLVELKAPVSGTITEIHSKELGLAGIHIGVGRQNSESPLDPVTGFEMRTTVGDRVEKGQPLLVAHLRNAHQFDEIREQILSAFVFSDSAPSFKPAPLVMEIVE